MPGQRDAGETRGDRAGHGAGGVCAADGRGWRTRRTSGKDRTTESEAGRGRGNSDRDGNGRRQSADASRTVGLRGDGGDAVGGIDADAGARRLDAWRRDGDGTRKGIGTVEKGKSADLLLVAADPTADVANLRKVRYVVRGGVVRSIEELKATVAASKD